MVTIAEAIKFYAELEPLFLRKDLEVVKMLRTSIQGVYEHILRFLCLAKKYFNRNASMYLVRKITAEKAVR